MLTIAVFVVISARVKFLIFDTIPNSRFGMVWKTADTRLENHLEGEVQKSFGSSRGEGRCEDGVLVEGGPAKHLCLKA